MIDLSKLENKLIDTFTHQYEEVLLPQDYADITAMTKRTAALLQTFVCGDTCPELSSNTNLAYKRSAGVSVLTITTLPKTISEAAFLGLRFRFKNLLQSKAEVSPYEAVLCVGTTLDSAYTETMSGELDTQRHVIHSLLIWELTHAFNRDYSIILKGIYRKGEQA